MCGAGARVYVIRDVCGRNSAAGIFLIRAWNVRYWRLNATGSQVDRRDFIRVLIELLEFLLESDLREYDDS